MNYQLCNSIPECRFVDKLNKLYDLRTFHEAANRFTEAAYNGNNESKLKYITQCREAELIGTLAYQDFVHTLSKYNTFDEAFFFLRNKKCQNQTKTVIRHKNIELTVSKTDNGLFKIEQTGIIYLDNRPIEIFNFEKEIEKWNKDIRYEQTQ